MNLVQHTWKYRWIDHRLDRENRSGHHNMELKACRHVMWQNEYNTLIDSDFVLGIKIKTHQIFNISCFMLLEATSFCTVLFIEGCWTVPAATTEWGESVWLWRESLISDGHQEHDKPPLILDELTEPEIPFALKTRSCS